MRNFLNLGLITGISILLLSCQPAGSGNPPAPVPVEPYVVNVERADGGRVYGYTKAGLLKKSDLKITVQQDMFSDKEDVTSDVNAVVTFYDNDKNLLTKLVNPDDSIEIVHGKKYKYTVTWKGLKERNSSDYNDTQGTTINSVVSGLSGTVLKTRLIGFNMNFGSIDVIDDTWYNKSHYEKVRKYDASSKKYYDKESIYFYIKNNGTWSEKHTEYPTDYVIKSGDESVKFFYGDGDDVNSPEGLECPFTAIELTSDMIIQNTSASLDTNSYSSLRYTEFTAGTEYGLADFSKHNLDNSLVDTPVAVKVVKENNKKYEDVGLLKLMKEPGQLVEGAKLYVYGPYESKDITSYEGTKIDLYSETFIPVNKPYGLCVEYTKDSITIKTSMIRYNSNGEPMTISTHVIQPKEAKKTE
ncbi:MAG: hypothetical protein KBT21_06755 [Treponema sp.]|nr:hypothetical protein [Candidatus Treponema merdequi]